MQSQTQFHTYMFISAEIEHLFQVLVYWLKVIVEKSRGEGSLMEQDTIENVS